MREVRLLVLDDHPPIREGIAAFLGASGSYEVVGSVGRCEEARHLVRTEKPDVVILDLSLPDGNGLDLIREIAAEHPEIRIMVLTMHARRPLADQAFAAGAAGYLLKESTGDLLIAGLERVIAGERVIDPALTTAAERSGCADDWVSPGSDLGRLSARELEVFRLLAIGQSGKQIAQVLSISPKTVDNHRARIMEKLCFSTVAELVRTAIRTGVIEP